MSDLVAKTMQSPVGRLTLVADKTGLTGVLFETSRHPHSELAAAQKVKKHPVLDKAEKQLREYFAGKRKQFDVPLSPTGTAFQKKVWKGLTQIPFGETLSYGGLARKIKSPTAARAVGMANGRNPIAIIVPCHRVIGENGRLVGFGGGLGVKARLLKLEGLSIPA